MIAKKGFFSAIKLEYIDSLYVVIIDYLVLYGSILSLNCILDGCSETLELMESLFNLDEELVMDSGVKWLVSAWNWIDLNALKDLLVYACLWMYLIMIVRPSWL